MPNHVAQFDCTFNDAVIELDLTSAPYAGAVSEIWAEWDIAFNATYVTAVLAQAFSQTYNECYDSGFGTTADINLEPISSVLKWVAYLDGASFPPNTPYAPSPAITSNQFYRIKFHMIAGSPPTLEMWIDSVSIGAINTTGATKSDIGAWRLRASGLAHSGALVYMDNFIMGTTEGGSDLASDDFESGGSSPDATIWNSFISGSSTIITDPGINPPGAGTVDSAIVVGKTTVSSNEVWVQDTITTIYSKTTLTGSYSIASFTLHAKDYDWGAWSIPYSYDGSIPVAGSVGAFDNDNGILT
jgi:hypothetical protein